MTATKSKTTSLMSEMIDKPEVNFNLNLTGLFPTDYREILESSVEGAYTPLPSTAGGRERSGRSGCQAPPHPLRIPRIRKAMTARAERRVRFAIPD